MVILDNVDAKSGSKAQRCPISIDLGGEFTDRSALPAGYVAQRLPHYRLKAHSGAMTGDDDIVFGHTRHIEIPQHLKMRKCSARKPLGVMIAAYDVRVQMRLG